jgi:hypothetical protein
MFGCSDVYHWMGRTAKAVLLAGLRTYLPCAVLARQHPNTQARGDVMFGCSDVPAFGVRCRSASRTQVNPTIRLPVKTRDSNSVPLRIIFCSR